MSTSSSGPLTDYRATSRRRAAIVLVLGVLGVGVCSVSSSALEIQDVRWGIDGAPCTNGFQMLSVLLRNDDAAPYEGQLTLASELGSSNFVYHTDELVIAPGALRWVQFFPYTTSSSQSWRLSEGLLQRVHRIESLAADPAVAVRLVDADLPSAIVGAIRDFPERLFPPSAAALGAVERIILDHDPDWGAAQRAALCDWVSLGGELHVLSKVDGELPEFSGQLAQFIGSARLSGATSVATSARVGRGLVSLSSKTLRDARGEFERLPVKARIGDLSLSEQESSGFMTAEGLVDVLQRQNAPKTSWGRIFTLLIIYVVLVGPVNAVLVHRTRKYGQVLLLLLVVIALFSAGFYWLLRDDFIKVSGLLVASHARVGGEVCLVEHQAIAQVAYGGAFNMRHTDPHALFGNADFFASAMRFAAVPGAMVMELPFNVGASFVASGVTKAPLVKPEVLAQIRAADSDAGLSAAIHTGVVGVGEILGAVRVSQREVLVYQPRKQYGNLVKERLSNPNNTFIAYRYQNYRGLEHPVAELLAEWTAAIAHDARRTEVAPQLFVAVQLDESPFRGDLTLRTHYLIYQFSLESE
ncbi:MAG: hypothetical protein ACKVX7_04360 [Planctomycetota bacterium]